MKLYSIQAHDDGERYGWVRGIDKTRQLPYAELIHNYDPSKQHNSYVEHALDEYFTEDEVKALKAYLEQRYSGVTHIIAEVELPMPDCFPVGLCEGPHITLGSRCPDYNLPFESRAYLSRGG